MAPKATQPRHRFADIGARLELLREKNGLTDTAFARSIGMKQNTYSPWEQGKRRPKIESALLICDKYNVTLDWLYRGVKETLPFETQRQLGLLPSTKPSD